MKFISILGYDRSGTTFLGSYLNYFGKNVFYAGEIDKGLEHYFNGSIKKCTCGKLFTECDIWGKILPKLEKGKIDFEFIFREIRSLTGADIIVDSSKSKKLVTEFQKINGKDHFTVFVKRNPKAVALSRMKIRKHRVSKGSHPKPAIAKRYNIMMVYDCMEWNFYNIWAEGFKREDNNLDLVYDHFDKQLPEKIISFIKNKELSEIEEGTISSHIIWGNKGRSNFNKEIRINHNWKNGLDTFQKLTVNFITYPIRKFYRYSF